MINLLPYDYKKEIRAGRANTILMRYISILSIGVVILGGIFGGAYVVIYGAHQNALATVEANQAQEAEFAAVRERANSFRSDLATAKTILDKQVIYSKIIYDIADAVPSGIVLDSVELSPETLGSSVTLSASARTNSDAIKLKDEFTKQASLFTDVKLISISGGTSDMADGGGGAYPVKVSISVTLQKGSPS